jgi:hypothetical protein
MVDSVQYYRKIDGSILLINFTKLVSIKYSPLSYSLTNVWDKDVHHSKLKPRSGEILGSIIMRTKKEKITSLRLAYVWSILPW